MIARDHANLIYRNSFAAFVHVAFFALYKTPLQPNWHIDHLCFEVEKMVTAVGIGRLVANLPPRKLKSFIISVALPAWLLGRDPTARILCASYSEDLAFTFSRDCRALMETKFYKDLFPQTRISRKKATEGEFETTKHGFRVATSVGGTLTGRGGFLLIIDDPIKAKDAGSQSALAAANEWFRTTALNRMDDPRNNKIIVTMQRLHVEDLAGLMIEAGWPAIVLPAIATEDADYALSATETYHRSAGELLQVDRDTHEFLDTLKRGMGSAAFAAQFQQNPTPPEGHIIKAGYLLPFDPDGKHDYKRVILSCDPAFKAGSNSDYTAIVICGYTGKDLHILHVARGHWTVMEMQRQIEGLSKAFGVGLVVVEETASGAGLLQLLKEKANVNAIGRHPKGDKETRLAQHLGTFEANRILVPKDAPWLPDFLSELFSFPNGRYDDQLDALLQLLDWLVLNASHLEMRHAAPILVRLVPFDLTSANDRWSNNS